MKPRAGLVILTLLSSSTFLAGADPLSPSDPAKLLAGLPFSQAYEILGSGRFAVFPQQSVAGSILTYDLGFTDQERDALLEMVLLQTEATGNEEQLRNVTRELLRNYALLVEPGLRAEVLRNSANLNVPNLEHALLESGRRLVQLTRESGTRPGMGTYEVEALQLARLGPRFPSAALAELLRRISVYSHDRRVVEACRASAREIITLL